MEKCGLFQINAIRNLFYFLSSFMIDYVKCYQCLCYISKYLHTFSAGVISTLDDGGRT